MLFASLAALIVLKLASPAVAFPAPQGEGISLVSDILACGQQLFDTTTYPVEIYSRHG